MNAPELPDILNSYISPLTLEQNLVVWNYLNIYLAQIIAFHWRKEIQAYSALDSIAQFSDVTTATTLLYGTYDLKFDTSTSKRMGRFSKLVELLLIYAVNMLNVNINQENGETLSTLTDFLEYTDFKVSKLFLGMSDLLDDVDDDYIYTEGFWFYENSIQDDAGVSTLYFFELDVASDANFTDILFSMDSQTDQTGWYYEETTGNFVEVPVDGIPFEYIGNRIKYDGSVSQYLTRGEIYYFRIRQKTLTADYTYRRNEGIIYT